MTTVTLDEIRRIAEWAGRTDSGDSAELSWAPSDTTWRAVSVGSDECPGAERCPLGEPCFAEQARRRAAVADVVVVNTHLYGLARRQRRRHPAGARRRRVRRGPRPRGRHERHRRRPGRPRPFRDAGRDRAADPRRPGAHRRDPRSRRRPARGPATVRRPAAARAVSRGHPGGARRGPHAARPRGDGAAGHRHPRRRRQAAQAAGPADDRSGRRPARPRDHRRTTATSTTCRARRTTPAWRSPRSTSDRSSTKGSGAGARPCSPAPPCRRRSPSRLGLPAERTDAADVGSPFDYAHHALLYCALHLPDPRSERYRDALHEELAALITAAGGRTLALFTSWKAMDLAAAALRDRLATPGPHPARPAQAGARRPLRRR